MIKVSKLQVLIIEDDENKLENISSLIKGINPTTVISIAKSVKTAINLLDSQKYDLIFADMSLPTYEIRPHETGGTPRPFGGVEIFDYLEMKEAVVPIIVVTSYPKLTEGKTSLNYKDLEKQLMLDYPDNFIGLVYFDSSITDWEKNVLNILNEKFESTHVK
jgi:CheY-like chemotaxis protein